MNFFRKNRSGIAAGIAGFLLLLQMVPFAAAEDDDAYSGYTADTLTVEVGYFGGPYYEKKVFTAEELWELPLVQEDYTFIDNMPSVVIDHVVGVRLDDLMKEAGIDVNSIETFYFWTHDKTSDYFTSYAKTELLDTTRYCYYSLPDNFDSEAGVGGEGADAVANPVPTVMALSDDWNRCIQGAEFGSDYMDLDTATRFRLIFGQTDTSTRTANRSAKWVHKIVVALGGAPTMTVDTADLDMEVGSVRRVHAEVHAADNAVSAGASISWSSSDESVATVDEEGNVTVVGEGSAVITASSGSTSASFRINGTGKKEENEEQDQEKDKEEEASEPAAEVTPEDPASEEPPVAAEVKEEPQAAETIVEAPPAAAGTRPSSSASVSPSSSASVSPSLNPETPVGSRNGSTASASQDPVKRDSTQEEKREDPKEENPPVKVQGVTLDGTGDNPITSVGEEPETTTSAVDEKGGVQNWRIYEMSEVAQELPEIEMDNPLLGFTRAASGSLLLAGGVIEYVLYRRRF